MFYLISVPVACLLYRSMYVLMEKYMGREPVWLKSYIIIVFAYIVATPILLMNYISDILGFANSTTAYLMLSTGFIVFFLVIKFSPSKKIKKDEFREWQ